MVTRDFGPGVPDGANEKLVQNIGRLIWGAIDKKIESDQRKLKAARAEYTEAYVKRFLKKTDALNIVIIFTPHEVKGTYTRIHREYPPERSEQIGTQGHEIYIAL